MYNQMQGLPVPTNSVDQSTFNGNLPQGNDKIPPIQVSQFQQQNQNVFIYAIGCFRSIMQSTVNRSPLHVFTYNLLSAQHFNNSAYAQWCQHVVDFTEFLMRARQKSPQEAVEVAVKKVYESCLGAVVKAYPVLLNMNVIPQELMNGLNMAQALYQQILNDINTLKSGGFNHNTVQQTLASFGGQPFSNGNSFNNHQNMFTTAQSSVNTSNQNNGSPFYNDANSTLQPKEEISNEIYGGFNTTSNTPMQTHSVEETKTIVHEHTDLPIPSTVEEVVIDPMYYQPSGSFKVDIARPYDIIYNPGGVEIRPAHQVDWERSVGNDNPYSLLVNPKEYCRFFVKFPDGIIKEKYEPWNEHMQYLQHELDTDLRNRYYTPKGRVVASDTPISTIGGDIKTLQEVSENEGSDVTVTDELAPVIIEDIIFTGGNVLEIESDVRDHLRKKLDLKDGQQLPSHEYRSINIHQMDIDDDLYSRLCEIASSTDLIDVANMLKTLVDTGGLSIRYFRYMDERLTKAINDFLKDNLSMSISIDSYCNDIGELLDYISAKKGDKILNIIKNKSQYILHNAITFGEADDARGIFDQYVTFQVGWTLNELSTLNINNENAVLVSKYSSPVLLNIIISMVKRYINPGDFAKLRLVTADGVYLEVIQGYLVDKAILLKRV